MSKKQTAPARQSPLVWFFLLFFLLTTILLGLQLLNKPRIIGTKISGPLSCEVFFSPNGGCTEAIDSAISAAQTRILVQAYSFTSRSIAESLLEAKKRGVEVQVILDKSQRTEHYSEADFFAHMGIPTYIDAMHSIAHNKIIIIDSDTVITGSFNFTKAAEERNAENLLIIHNPTMTEKYIANWQEHLGHSEAYAGR